MKHRIRNVGIFSIVGWAAASGTLIGQSREELRRKYGEPVSETFVARPGITVTATYGTNGRIAELLISPENTALIKSRGATLSRESVDAIIDDLVPRSIRGKYLIAGFVNAACIPENDCNGTSVGYEKISIYYNAATEGRVHYAVVQLKE
jgi:hypothetical protein